MCAWLVCVWICLKKLAYILHLINRVHNIALIAREPEKINMVPHTVGWVSNKISATHKKLPTNDVVTSLGASTFLCSFQFRIIFHSPARVRRALIRLWYLDGLSICTDIQTTIRLNLPVPAGGSLLQSKQQLRMDRFSFS